MYHEVIIGQSDKPQPERELGDYVLRVSVRVDPPFVMGAMMKGGKWGFHS